MRGETVVRQRFPVGEVKDQTVGKLANFVVQTQCVLHIWGHQDHRTRMALSDLRHERGAGCTRQFT
ncbi:hypothetical protein D3C87_1745970 [compost metagenome]